MKEFLRLFHFFFWDTNLSIYHQRWESWNIIYRTNINDGEDLLGLLTRLDDSVISDASESRQSKMGSYKRRNSHSQKRLQSLTSHNGIWKLIWRTKLPMKIICYNWLGITWSMLDPGQPRHKKLSNYNQMQYAQKTVESITHCSTVQLQMTFEICFILFLDLNEWCHKI